MSGNLFKFTHTFGVVDGIKLYLNRKYKKASVVKFPFLKYPVILRGQTTKSDVRMFEQIFYTKDYEIAIPIEPKIIVDLGANVGFASLYFSNRFPTSSIVALEPNKENFEAAYENVKRYENIRLIHGAAWHKVEEVSVVDKGHGEAAFMIEPGRGERTVNTYTVKSIMDIMKTDCIDVLKIDIEGSEKEIFDYGYEEWLPKTKIVIVETHDRYRKGTSKSVLTAICKYDFSLEISGENLVFYNNDLLNPY
jgi:FkbM family methyltransferase